VDKLFENLPVRKKFLKSQRSNEAEILRFLKHFAMINSGLELVALFDGKEVLRTYASNTMLDLSKIVFGESRIMQGEYGNAGIQATVCTTHPAIQRKRRDAIYIGVNGRVIKDMNLVQAVIQAYYRLLPANAYPAACVDVRVEPSLVDVNIHPTKSEVRFEATRSQELFTAVHRATEAALQNFTAVVYAEAEEMLNNELIEQPKMTVDMVEMDASTRNDPFLKVMSPSNPHAVGARSARPIISAFDMSKEFVAVKAAPATAYTDYAPEPMPLIANVEADKALSFSVIGQLEDMYIIARSPAGDLVVIDQHVAHERVLYEKYLAERMAQVPSITLFEPVVISISLEEMELLDNMADELAKFGYSYESFGPNEIKVTRVPADKLKKDTANEFMDIVQNAMDNRKSRSQDYAIVTMACKNAIKAGDPLSHYEMQQLVDMLFRAKNPHTCPHGRPIVFTMALADLHKKFQR
jgi:DNA mismatch repair protein MutL